VETAAAGAQSGDLPGRPGLNLVRAVRTYHLDKEHFAMAKELASVSGVNAEKERSIRLGYSVPFPEGKLPFGGVMFVEDERNFVEAKPNPKDMARIENEIREARRQADVVLVSIHSHDCPGGVGNKPTDFLETFSRNCIDAGAHAVLGHGPHELRGIEVYKGGVIFHGLGNFIFETETVEFQPADAYLNRSMPLDTKVGAYMDERSQNGTRGFAVQEWIWKSVMAGFTMEDGRITQVQLYPIDLGQNKPRGQKGKPVMTYDENTLAYLAGLSEPYGTTLRVDNGVGYIDL
jgi:poly-gamma-glutamate synthesis protein (capsule biosynthesis protein)